MDDGQTSPPTADPGAAALAFLLQLLGLPAHAAALLHQSGKARLDDTDLLRSARRFPVKVRIATMTGERLARCPTPFLARVEGGWLVVGRVGDDKILVQDPLAKAPQSL